MLRWSTSRILSSVDYFVFPFVNALRCEGAHMPLCIIINTDALSIMSSSQIHCLLYFFHKGDTGISKSRHI